MALATKPDDLRTQVVDPWYVRKRIDYPKF